MSDMHFHIYLEYLHELAKYDSSVNELTHKDIKKLIRFYESESGVRWINIILGSKLIGFLIIGFKGSECHPDADYTILQIYVKPDYRHSGLASEYVYEFISKHSGIYALDVIKGNEPAEQFWKHIFNTIEATPIELKEVRENAKKLNLYGYKVN